jgi:hypothetical protein
MKSLAKSLVGRVSTTTAVLMIIIVSMLILKQAGIVRAQDDLINTNINLDLKADGVRATLTLENGTFVENEQIDFYLNDNLLGSGLTNSEGFVDFPTNESSIKAVFNGNSYLNSSESEIGSKKIMKQEMENNTLPIKAEEPKTVCENGICSKTFSLEYTPVDYKELDLKFSDKKFQLSYKNNSLEIIPFLVIKNNEYNISSFKNLETDYDIKDEGSRYMWALKLLKFESFLRKFDVDKRHPKSDVVFGFDLSNNVKKYGENSFLWNDEVIINFSDLVENNFEINIVNDSRILIGNLLENMLGDESLYLDPTIEFAELKPNATHQAYKIGDTSGTTPDSATTEFTTNEYGNVSLGDAWNVTTQCTKTSAGDANDKCYFKFTFNTTPFIQNLGSIDYLTYCIRAWDYVVSDGEAWIYWYNITSSTWLSDQVLSTSPATYCKTFIAGIGLDSFCNSTNPVCKFGINAQAYYLGTPGSITVYVDKVNLTISYFDSVPVVSALSYSPQKYVNPNYYTTPNFIVNATVSDDYGIDSSGCRVCLDTSSCTNFVGGTYTAVDSTHGYCGKAYTNNYNDGQQLYAKVSINDTIGQITTSSTGFPIVDAKGPNSSIPSPAEGSWQTTTFSANLSYNETPTELKNCEYEVNTTGGTTVGWTSAGSCSGNSWSVLKSITVGSSGNCNVEGTNKCSVQVRANDSLDNQGSISIKTFSIDYNAPTYTNNVSSTVSVYTPTGYSNFSITWNDNSDSLAGAYLENNFSGSLANTTMSGSYPSYFYNSSVLKANTYQYRFVANDSFGKTNTTPILYFTIAQAPTTATIFTNGTTTNKTSVYPNSTINVTATSSVSGLYVQIWRNNSLKANTTSSSTNISQWGAYNNNFTAKVLGNENYSDSAATMLWWNVSQGPTNISLYLNDTEDNKSYNQNDVANFTVKLNVTGKTVNLTSNYTGWVTQTGPTPLMNYTTLSTTGTWYNLTGYFEGDENYSSSSKTYFFNVTVAMPPQWVAGSNSTNTTLAGQPANLTLNWTDNYQLAGYIFSTNNTGTWSNSSYITFSGTTNTSWNVTTLNSTVGSIVSWCFYANDTSGNMNATNCQAGNEFYLNTTEAIVSFTVRLPDNINYSSSTSGGSTADEEFNATSSTIANVTPCIRGDPSKCQTQLLANFIVNNTGNLNENITICLNQSLSSKFAVWGTLTGDPYNSVNIIPNCSYSAWKANESLLINAVDEFWIWTNFTGASTDDSTARMLYINSTQSGA